MARMILAFALCGLALALTPAAAQNDNAAARIIEIAPPAPNDSPTGSIEPAAPKEAPALENKEASPAEKPPQVSNPPAGDKPQTESKAPESPPVESAPQQGTAAESKPADNAAEGRFTFTRMNDGYVRLDNRTGQVSVCSKRTVGWTCQLAAEDRGALESEINRLQDENVALKKELLANGLPLPGSMKGEPPVAHKEHSFSLPSDQNIDRMKAMVEKAWRRLVDMISTLQKDVLKKS